MDAILDSKLVQNTVQLLFEGKIDSEKFNNGSVFGKDALNIFGGVDSENREPIELKKVNDQVLIERNDRLVTELNAADEADIANYITGEQAISTAFRSVNIPATVQVNKDDVTNLNKILANYRSKGGTLKAFVEQATNLLSDRVDAAILSYANADRDILDAVMYQNKMPYLNTGRKVHAQDQDFTQAWARSGSGEDFSRLTQTLDFTDQAFFDGISDVGNKLIRRMGNHTKRYTIIAVVPDLAFKALVRRTADMGMSIKTQYFGPQNNFYDLPQGLERVQYFTMQDVVYVCGDIGAPKDKVLVMPYNFSARKPIDGMFKKFYFARKPGLIFPSGVVSTLEQKFDGKAVSRFYMYLESKVKNDYIKTDMHYRILNLIRRPEWIADVTLTNAPG